MSVDADAGGPASTAFADPTGRDRDRRRAGDRLVIGIGDVVAWIFPILMLAIVFQVVARKLGHNQAWLDDAQWWLYGFATVYGFGYAIATKAHVRVDIFHQRFAPSAKAWLEVFALGWLLLPFVAIMVDVMTHYALASIAAREGSDSPNGLHRLYLLKSTLPVLFALAGVAALSALLRELSRVTTIAPWKVVLAALPFALFVAERAAHHALRAYVGATRPDLEPRAIAKEPLLQHSATLAAALVLLVVSASFLRARSPRRGGEG